MSERIGVVDPRTGEQVADVPVASPAEVAAACERADAAWRSTWRRTTPQERADALLAAAATIEAHADELSAIEARESGKSIEQMSEDEMPAVVDCVRWYAGAARVLEGRAGAEYLEGIHSWIRREPVGVCGQIAPWNYPLMMAVWKWAPAVAAGNTTVLKPSELTPSSTVRMAELLADVLPDGVLNVVTGAAATGEAIVRDPRVAMVSLTGSIRAGQAVAAAAAGSLKRVHLELGGNAPVVVFADADLESAAEQIAFAAFYNAGQDCTAASRVLVDASAADELSDRLADAASSTECQPLISSRQRERVEGLLERLPSRATVRCGGKRLDRPGWWFPPTVVTGLDQSDEIVQEEIFGPVITVQEFADESAAVAMANGVPQGLTASVWTSDVARALRLTGALDFGAVSVNTHAPMASEMPHGGFGVSGYGKDLSMYGFEDYTRIKHVAVALG